MNLNGMIVWYCLKKHGAADIDTLVSLVRGEQVGSGSHVDLDVELSTGAQRKAIKDFKLGKQVALILNELQHYGYVGTGEIGDRGYRTYFCKTADQAPVNLPVSKEPLPIPPTELAKWKLKIHAEMAK